MLYAYTCLYKKEKIYLMLKKLNIILNCVINETELFQVKISYDLFNFYS